MTQERLREIVASWVVVDRSTGKALLETFNPRTADRVDLERFEVVPILAWLQRVHRAAKGLVAEAPAKGEP